MNNDRPTPPPPFAKCSCKPGATVYAVELDPGCPRHGISVANRRRPPAISETNTQRTGF